MKEIRKMLVKDFTSIVQVDSMMIICRDHLEVNEKKIDNVHKVKDIWKMRLEHIGVPKQKELIKFMDTHKEWKEEGI